MRAVRLVRLREDSVLFREGDPTDALYFVADGALLPSIDSPAQRTLAVLRPGDVFGELALVSDGPRTATVRALGDTTLLELDQDAARALLREEPGLAALFLRFLRDRLAEQLVATSPLFVSIDTERRARSRRASVSARSATGPGCWPQGAPVSQLVLCVCGRFEAETREGAEADDAGLARSRRGPRRARAGLSRARPRCRHGPERRSRPDARCESACTPRDAAARHGAGRTSDADAEAPRQRRFLAPAPGSGLARSVAHLSAPGPDRRHTRDEAVRAAPLLRFVRMRLANHQGRAVLLGASGCIDLERTSDGRFGADPMQAIARWDVLREWAATHEGLATGPLPDEAELGPPVPRPSKVFGIGLNYRDHAEEAGLELPKSPLVFTKFPSCLAGPRAPIVLSSDRVDWEVELVAVIGRGGRGIQSSRALQHVAGYCAGQDISDRRLQFSDRPPQFSMGKSYDGYGPIGPALVSLDAIPRPDDVALRCQVSGEAVQDGRSSNMVFSVAELVSFLSSICTLECGDLIFTGTPAGVGSTRKPPRYLKPGDEIVSVVEDVGTLRNRCIAAS